MVFTQVFYLSRECIYPTLGKILTYIMKLQYILTNESPLYLKIISIYIFMNGCFHLILRNLKFFNNI